MLSRDEFCARAEIAIDTLQVWVEEGWVVPDAQEAELRFAEIDLARARLIHDLKHDLGVNDEGIGVVLALLDQLHGVRAAFRAALRVLAERRPLEGGAHEDDGR